MKKLFIYIVIGVGLLMTACDLEGSDNGDLDGMWYLQSVDSLGTNHSANMRDSQFVWCVQGKILEVKTAALTEKTNDIIFQFEHTGDVLRVYSPLFCDRDNGDIPVEDVTYLRHFGINQLEEKFEILQLTNDWMTLESERLRLNFRRY